MIKHKRFSRAGLASLAAISLVLLTACKNHRMDGMSGADLNVYNHGPDGIVSVQVDGYGGPTANAYGGGGGYCCVMVPDVWKPGLTAKVTWTSDPNSWIDPRHIPDDHASHYQKHGPITVPIERWTEDEACNFDVHIWPCDKVRIVRSCHARNSPEYPIQAEPDRNKKAQNILIKHIKENITCPTPQTAH
ncbi:DUF3304 domain-containing protein [Citrobacter werkmanii]|uniref:DUF3304 domain-containing protein n=1 Tax=Citrobacter werkmanii TaxID=67827 RepID=UPI0026538262|nr:DUF3304 domain-containing protein [Citrobacter werkmanii]MDN8559109.1 DUF3304 domain-containing protein [Citrobacter werkmanii]